MAGICKKLLTEVFKIGSGLIFEKVIDAGINKVQSFWNGRVNVRTNPNNNYVGPGFQTVGGHVSALQQCLKDLGYNIAVDGIYGPDTRTALMGFQRANKLSVDGICGPATWNALYGK